MKCFVSAKPCGCLTFAAFDDGTSRMANDVLGLIRDGRSVEYVDGPVTIGPDCERCRNPKPLPTISDMCGSIDFGGRVTTE